MAFSGRAHLEEGDKILLPPSALQTLARLSVDYPMLFSLISPLNKATHCGVLEFSAEEGRCYIPFWMMQNLLLSEGSLITIKNVSLPKAKFVKFRPQSVEFLNISNPRAVLENSLRKFTCLTLGDQIAIQYLDQNYYLEVKEVKPSDAVSIIETDCEVDFEEPVGYQDSHYAKYEKAAKEEKKVAAPPRELQKAKSETLEELAAAEKVFKPFSGGAQRIDGKSLGTSAKSDKESKDVVTVNNKAIADPIPSTIAQPRVSRIGDKYSKNKVAVSAFTGPGNTLKK
jgi:ubiquitin fusion degradation protein 1